MNFLFKAYQYFVWVATVLGGAYTYYDVYLSGPSEGRGYSLLVFIPGMVLIYFVYGVFFLIKSFHDKGNLNSEDSKESTSDKPFWFLSLILIGFALFIYSRFFS